MYIKKIHKNNSLILTIFLNTKIIHSKAVSLDNKYKQNTILKK